jgi:hypothetical protein
MADDVWSRPRIPTGESVAAALHLAKELKPDEGLLCEGDDGATELLVRKGGELLRYVAHESGATEQIEVREPTPRYRLARRLIYAGLLCIPLIVAAGFLFKPENSTLWIGGPIMLALGLILGSTFMQKHPDLSRLVPNGAACARIPYDLGGWKPRSAGQLAAVEQLYEEGDDAPVRVRADADGGIEVETFCKRERRLHMLDAHGAVLEQERTRLRGKVYWARRVAGAAFVIPLLALVLFDGPRVFIGGMAVYLLICLVAWRIDLRKHTARPGENWFEVRTEPPSD